MSSNARAKSSRELLTQLRENILASRSDIVHASSDLIDPQLKDAVLMLLCSIAAELKTALDIQESTETLIDPVERDGSDFRRN